MSTQGSPLEGATCEKCGNTVHMDGEGMVACDGCDKNTERCTCAEQT